MVKYNPKEWFKLIFQFHKSDTFRKLFPTMLLLGLFTAIIVYLEVDFFHVHFKGTTIVHSLLGFVLSMLLVFRINSAYDRWWEGRKLWGSLVNNSRSLAIKLHSFLPKEKKEIRAGLAALISNYVYVTKEHLRAGFSSDEYIENDLLRIDELRLTKHKPNMIMRQLNEEIHNLQVKGILMADKLRLINEELRAYTEILGACERIKNTPIPFSYSIFLKKMIFIYVITMPVGFSVEFHYWSVPIVMLIFYAFASLEVLSEEIENPFGTDANDLPTDELAAKIKENVYEILLEKL